MVVWDGGLRRCRMGDVTECDVVQSKRPTWDQRRLWRSAEVWRSPTTKTSVDQNLSEYHLVCKLNKREDQTDTVTVINQPYQTIVKDNSLDL